MFCEEPRGSRLLSGASAGRMSAFFGSGDTIGPSSRRIPEHADARLRDYKSLRPFTGFLYSLSRTPHDCSEEARPKSGEQSWGRKEARRDAKEASKESKERSLGQGRGNRRLMENNPWAAAIVTRCRSPFGTVVPILR